MSLVNSDLLTEFYKSHYRVVSGAGAVTDITKIFWQKRADALSKLAKTHTSRPTLRIFEVGAGYGINLLAMREVFPEAELWTDEPSEVTTSRSPAIGMCSLNEGAFDIIILSHVLEHFEDPKDLLQRVGAALTEGGIAIVEVPNDIDNIERYNGTDEPHLTFFEMRSFSTLLSKLSGLQTVDTFVAGPSVVRTSPIRFLRKIVGKIIRTLPFLRSTLGGRAISKVRNWDFEKRNPEGMFLRTVLRKP